MIRPTAIFVEEPESDVVAHYRVLFETDDGGQVEHVFPVHTDGDLDGVKLTDPYRQVMPPEPFTKWLCESIIYLHQAIRVVRSDSA